MFLIKERSITHLAYILFPPVPCDSHKTAQQVMASDWISFDFFTQADVRRYLNSNANNIFKLIYMHIRMCDVHKTERTVHDPVQRPFEVRSISVPSPFVSRLTSV